MAEMIREGVQNKGINRFLRCTKTQRYFDGTDWTEDPSQAKTFPDEIAAARACVEKGLQNVELVLRAPGSNDDIFTTVIR